MVKGAEFVETSLVGRACRVARPGADVGACGMLYGAGMAGGACAYPADRIERRPTDLLERAGSQLRCAVWHLRLPVRRSVEGRGHRAARSFQARLRWCRRKAVG